MRIYILTVYQRVLLEKSVIPNHFKAPLTHAKSEKVVVIRPYFLRISADIEQGNVLCPLHKE